MPCIRSCMGGHGALAEWPVWFPQLRGDQDHSILTLNEDISPLFLNSLFALVNLFCGYCTPILKALLQTNMGFPGDSVVKNPPANRGDTGSMPGWGRNPMGKSIIAHQMISALTSLVKHKGSWSITAKPTVSAKVILPVWHEGAGTGTQHAPSQYQLEGISLKPKQHYQMKLLMNCNPFNPNGHIHVYVSKENLWKDIFLNG